MTDTDLLIFDLDGTLADTRLDLANAVNAMLAHMGKAQLASDLVATYVGNGAPMLVRRALGGGAASAAELDQGLAYFMKYYAAHALEHTRLYPGVESTLGRLGSAGKRMAVLTNKPTRVSIQILDGLGIGDRFFRVYGGTSFEAKKPDPVGLAKLMEEAGVGPERTVMVGDSSVDVHTARNAGVRCCGVTYGFKPETLADPAPDLLVDRFEQIADWVLDRHKGER